jgi:type IV pilus assembly protein PilQ
MYRTLMKIVPAVCVAMMALGARAQEGEAAAPPELAEYIAAVEAEQAKTIEVAQATAPGPQVIELEFEGKPKDQPDIFELPAFNEFVTLDFKNADIQNVIRLISARTGLNILLDPEEVSGTITLHLENVRLAHALDNILKVNKLAYIVESGDIVRIVPEERVGRDQVETQTVVHELNWRNAADVEATFRPFLSSHGSMKSNEEAQALIITDVPPNVAKIRELIAQIDRPDRQVVIEARLVDISVGALRALNSQWSIGKINKNAGLVVDDEGLLDIDVANVLANPTVGGVLPVFVEGLGINGGQGTLAFGSEIGILGDDYSVNATLTALERRNVVEVLANPRVTTLNNVPANIDIIQRIPYIEAVQGPTQGTVVGEVEFEDAGVKILVKPIITPNGFIRLDMGLEQRIFRSRVSTGASASAVAFNPPQIDVRKSQSTVIVRDKNTVVLGGLRGIENREAINGVPWLHRVPVIGWMFKDKNNEQARNELVLMVTPEVVDEATPRPRDADLYNMIDHEWHLPDYFMDDVKTEEDIPVDEPHTHN